MTKKRKVIKKDIKDIKVVDPTVLGVGDMIEAVTEATGIKKMVKAIFGDDCGCEERKEAINQIFGKKLRGLTEEEYRRLTDIFNAPKFTPEAQKYMTELYQDLFSKKLNSSCSSCGFVSNVAKPLEKVYNIYKNLLEQ